jgi:hypothetical protein
MLTEFGIRRRTGRAWAFRKALTEGMFTVVFRLRPIGKKKSFSEHPVCQRLFLFIRFVRVCENEVNATLVFPKYQSRLEDVKKSISFSFRDFIFDPKCLPTAQRSLIRHPGAIFLKPRSLQILKSIFSHLPDGITPIKNRAGAQNKSPLT